MPERSRWWALLWVIPAALLAFAAVVLLARWAREQPAIADFIATFPGETALPEWSPVGFPAWLGWQHALNALFLVMIVRTGWQLRTAGRPTQFWIRKNDGVIRTKNPPTRITLTTWFHLSLDALWVLNGILYFVLIFATGQWVRIVPISWDVFPHAISAGIQYASFDWPETNSWTHYNALQLLTYFITVFVAAPLAILTGIRLSPAWNIRMKWATPFVPFAATKTVHFVVMLWFIVFTIAHVTLVLTTGALRNLNQMYAGRQSDDWLGFWIFAASIVVTIVVWIAARPALLARIAALGGTVITRERR